MLAAAQIATFRDRGLLRLDRFLPRDVVDEARFAVRGSLTRQGLLTDGRWTLPSPRPIWPDGGRIAGKDANLGRAKALLTGDMVSAVQDLESDVDLTDRKGDMQVLFTLPNADAWFTPATIWHVDAPRLTTAGCPGVQVFTFLEPTEPGGGGTLTVAGSHRLLNDRGFMASRNVKQALRAEACFKALFDRNDADRGRLLGPIGLAGDVEIEVVEMAGKPGDVWLMDMRILHTLAPNAGSTPRIMLTKRYFRPAFLAEVGDRYGLDLEPAGAA